jgi:hypothetical protein
VVFDPSKLQGHFRISSALRDFHDHRQDPAAAKSYLVRLPDRQLVPVERYEEELARYKREHGES